MNAVNDALRPPGAKVTSQPADDSGNRVARTTESGLVATDSCVVDGHKF